MRNQFILSIFILLALIVFPEISKAASPVAGFGHSVEFDGSDDYIDIPGYISPTGDFTIEFWVKPTNLTSGWKGFFGYYSGSNTTRSPSMWQNGNSWHCDSYDLSGNRYEITIPNVFKNTGEWLHLAWVKKGTTYYYYRNGQQIQHRSAPSNGSYRTNNHLWIGKVDNHFDAYYDEVRVWSVARTQAQINDYRYRYISNPHAEAGLEYYWPMDDGSGTTATDVMGNANGTLTNGPVWANAASAPPIETNEDSQVSNYLKAIDIDGDALTFSFQTNPSKGTIILNDYSTGRYTYTPSPDENGLDSFTYIVNDGTSNSNAATINVNIVGTNDAPVGQSDAYSVGEDGALSVTTTNSILNNDRDVDGDHLSAVIKSQPTHGTLTLNPNGTFTYTPTLNYNGSDSFTYAPNDGTVDGNTATVTITVNASNDAPLGNPDSYTVKEDVTLYVSTANGFIKNDYDAEGDSITGTLQTTTTNGTLTMSASGGFIYVPDNNFNGTDSFTYVPTDGTDNGGATVVTLHVTSVNDAPHGSPDTYAIQEDKTLIVNLPGLLANDSDADGDHLTAIQTASPANGTLALHSDGSLTYTPNANFNGTDIFTYVANDGADNSSATTVTININSQNDVPVSVDNTYSIGEDSVLQVSTINGVLRNDTDIDGNTLHAVLETPPSNGILHLNSDGSFDYRPNLNFNGSDNFTYKANDGAIDSATATVRIQINSSNDAPVGLSDSYSMMEDGFLQVNVLQGVLTNDTDIEGDHLHTLLNTGPTNGNLHLNQDGSFAYRPDANFNGTDSFTYFPNDGSTNGSTVTVQILVKAVNDAPEGHQDAYGLHEDGRLTVPASTGVLANDTDADANILNAQVVSLPFHGSLNFQPDGSFEYIPVRLFHGTDSFTYQLLDGTDTTGPITVNLAISHVNHMPVTVNDHYSTPEDTALQVTNQSVISNDTDVDADLLTVQVQQATVNGTLDMSSNGNFIYRPNAGFNGNDQFTYIINDGAINSAPATVSITVNAVNDTPVASNDTFNIPVDALLDVHHTRGLLINDTDPDGDQLRIQTHTQPSNGHLHINADGGFTYKPDFGFSGTDSFTYSVTDGTLNSNTATATINIHAVNSPPTVSPISFISGANSALNLINQGTLVNQGVDPDSDHLQVVITSYPTHGSLRPTPDGSFVYIPDPDYRGPDTFTYFVYDGQHQSSPVQASMGVHGNDTSCGGGGCSTGSDSNSSMVALLLILFSYGVYKKRKN